MPRQRPGIHARDRRNARLSEHRGQLPGIVEHGGRGVGDDQTSQPGPLGLVVETDPAIVADERIGHDHELTRVRGIRGDLLVAGLARVHHEVALAGAARPKGDAGKDAAILEGQQSRPEIADTRIDYGARARQRRRLAGFGHVG